MKDGRDIASMLIISLDKRCSCYHIQKSELGLYGSSVTLKHVFEP